MNWKVVILGPTGRVYKDTNAFKLLYSFPTREEAEEHATCFSKTGIKYALADEQGNLARVGR
jgi:hypothetical protein